MLHLHCSPNDIVNSFRTALINYIKLVFPLPKNNDAADKTNYPLLRSVRYLWLNYRSVIIAIYKHCFRAQTITSYSISLCSTKKASKDLELIKTTECCFSKIQKSSCIRFKMQMSTVTQKINRPKIHRKMCVTKCNCSKGASSASSITNTYYFAIKGMVAISALFFLSNNVTSSKQGRATREHHLVISIHWV